jgi:hypothetical protein
MMSEFTYIVPDAQAFIHTLRAYLQTIGEDKVATLLMNSTCTISPSSSFSHIRWDAFSTSITIYVPVSQLAKFTDDVKKKLYPAIDAVFPKDAGYDITEIQVSPLLELPPDDSLKFRSQSEIKIYDVLKRRNVLFFANATAVLGNKNAKREPDFLICQDGKWGILEVMGEQYHTGTTAMKDHDRARLFKDYGLFFIEFYDAAQCYNQPDSVVSDFLARLSMLRAA